MTVSTNHRRVRNAGWDSGSTLVNIIVQLPVSNNIAELPGLGPDTPNGQEPKRTDFVCCTISSCAVDDLTVSDGPPRHVGNWYALSRQIWWSETMETFVC